MNTDDSSNSHNATQNNPRQGITPSASCDTLYLLQGLNAFLQYAQQSITQGRRYVDILSHSLPRQLYGDEDLCRSLSALVREHRSAEVRVLVRESDQLLGGRHSLVNLQQRLPSKIHIRKLITPPKNSHQGYLLVDRRALLLQHNDGEFDGFFNSEAAAEARSLLEEFNELWERQSSVIDDLKILGHL